MSSPLGRNPSSPAGSISTPIGGVDSQCPQPPRFIWECSNGVQMQAYIPLAVCLVTLVSVIVWQGCVIKNLRSEVDTVPSRRDGREPGADGATSAAAARLLHDRDAAHSSELPPSAQSQETTGGQQRTCRRRPDISIDITPQRRAVASTSSGIQQLPVPSPSSTAARRPPQGELDRVRRIGTGSGGTVWLVRHRPTGRVYALKVLHGLDHADRVREQISREVAVNRLVDHPAVVRCHGLYHQGGELQILLEHMDAGSLVGRTISDETFLAHVAYLHRLHIVHRDIKPANLLIDSSNRVKIADFGVSRILNQSIDPCHSAVGTVAYMSPERLNSSEEGAYDGYAADVWAFGMTMLELYIGRFPLGENLGGDWAALTFAICFTDPPGAPPTASPTFANFISSCLKKEPSRRLNARQLLQHPFVAEPEPRSAVRSSIGAN